METTMTKERPILFSGPLVRALLDGRKAQTRRVVKPQPTTDGYWWTWKDVSCNGESGLRDGLPCLGPCPYGFIGDRLWVRETWGVIGFPDSEAFNAAPSAIAFRADGSDDRVEKWKPSIHMPRLFSRITLEITDVRVQRLQDISEEDAKAEGCEPGCLTCGENCIYCGGCGYCRPAYRDSFINLWNTINGPDSWSANPWVWALTFRRIVAAANQ
jgi:hypothetical protein